MGLLEEAIREHLELKRSHGADPGEVADQERDALGPIQQRAAEPAAPATPDEPEEAAEYAGDAASDPFADVDDAAPVDEEYGGDDVSPPPPTAAEPPAAAPPATELFDAEDEPFAPDPPPEPEAEEDVLEETPEFLQETPEHDRLWFEQKPPRDFDFDR